MKSTKKQVKQSPANIYQFIKIFLCLLLCLSLVSVYGCQNDRVEAEEPSGEPNITTDEKIDQKIRLPYSDKDSLNPYFAKTLLNTSLSDLVYLKLFKIDDTFTPQPEIAAFANNADRSIKLNIHPDLFFSDKTNITAYDVVYSFNQAKISPLFEARLANINLAEALSAYEVYFELLRPDPYAINLLDFPIVKNNTANREKDLPIGSGPYVYRQSGREVILDHNLHTGKSRPKIKEIKLINYEDTSSLAYDIETGKISAYYTDLNTKRLQRMYASFAEVKLNNFVFLGLRHSNYSLSFQEVRRALSLAIDRLDICGSAYQGKARPAYTIFNPDWAVLASSEIDQDAYLLNYKEAAKILDKEGYLLNENTGIRQGNKGILSFSLLLNSENEYKAELANILAESLSKVGIKLNIKALPWGAYIDALSRGDYDLYLGEVKIPNNMDFSALFGEDRKALYGVYDESEIFNIFDEYLNGSIGPEAFNQGLQDHMPLIPLCYTSGLLLAGKNIRGNTGGLPGNIYENIYTWSVVQN